MGINPAALYQSALSDVGHLIPLHPDDLADTRIGKAQPEEWWSVTSVQALMLLKSLLKKWDPPSSAAADGNALSIFLRVANEVAQLDLGWRNGLASLGLESPVRQVLEETRWILQRSFHDHGYSPMDTMSILENLSVGPGASVGATGTSFYHKVAASPLTCSNSTLVRMYELYIRQPGYGLLLSTEESRREKFGPIQDGCCSKLGFAPKYSDVSRVICTEPSLNMMFQQGVSEVVVSTLRQSFGIQIKSVCHDQDGQESVQQRKNRILARLGSEHGTYATIDMSSASDRWLPSVYEYLLPPDLFWWMNVTRTPATRLPDGTLFSLPMMSTMGNGWTFSIMTMTFAAIVLGAYKVLGIKAQNPYGDRVGNWGVFGDDIIVKTKAFDLVVETLTFLGHEINKDKSFHKGSFRESCGADFWNGTWVRGVYCRRLRDPQDRYSLINRLTRWSATCSLPLPTLLGVLVKSVDTTFLVPLWDQDTAGIKVPWSVVSHTRAVFYHKDSSPSQPYYHGSVIYKRWKPRVNTIRVKWGSAAWQHGSRKLQLHWNPDGFIVAMLKGSIIGGRIGIRVNRTRYDATFGIAPGWDDTEWRPEFSNSGWARAWRRATEGLVQPEGPTR